MPEELTYKGQFMDFLEEFCTGRVQAASPEELALGKPWTDDGLTYFRIESLIKYRNNRFDTYSRGQIQRLKELNPDGNASDRKVSGVRRSVEDIRVWHIPAFSSEVEAPDIDIQGEDIRSDGKGNLWPTGHRQTTTSQHRGRGAEGGMDPTRIAFVSFQPKATDEALSRAKRSSVTIRSSLSGSGLCTMAFGSRVEEQMSCGR